MEVARLCFLRSEPSSGRKQSITVVISANLLSNLVSLAVRSSSASDDLTYRTGMSRHTCIPGIALLFFIPDIRYIFQGTFQVQLT